ncbi:MAG TPA: hypothetical protein VMI72_13905 [Roseiarcus sp.]|nr:hypothetical protein [Roseiarcus sp.]
MNDENNSCFDHNARMGQERSGLPAIVPVKAQAGQNETADNPKTVGYIHKRIGVVAAAALAVVAAAGALIMNEQRRQAAVFAERAKDTQALAQAVGVLSDRLSAMEGAKSRDELGQIRRSLREIRATVSNSKELSDALAQLSQRVDALNREENARVQKLNERLDREPSVRAAELSARIEKLEKKVVATAAPQPPPAPPAPSPVRPPKPGPNVSMEPTGSIRRPRPVLQGYVVLNARNQVALVEGRNGERAVRRGDYLPGAGRVERIERHAGNWVVLTDRGLIAEAEPDD